MAFTSNSGGGPMADINVTPLVDVMLVLLIIFMITVPIMSHKIMIDLPQKTNNPVEQPDPPKPLEISITRDGTLYLDGLPIQLEVLEAQFAVDSRKDPQPMVQIKADPFTQYEVLADLMGSARNSGMAKIGFEAPVQQ